jgi:sterol desaturase/sphingolipid hydroxylase (fatty acid hydroxylase superfamily)
MHGTHHSIVRRETDSNWGTIFSCWDRLHRSLRIDVPQDAITIGVPGWREERELTIGKLVLMPFRRQRDWRLPDGDVPEREPQRVHELAP